MPSTVTCRSFISSNFSSAIIYLQPLIQERFVRKFPHPRIEVYNLISFCGRLQRAQSRRSEKCVKPRAEKPEKRVKTAAILPEKCVKHRLVLPEKCVRPAQSLARRGFSARAAALHPRILEILHPHRGVGGVYFGEQRGERGAAGIFRGFVAKAAQRVEGVLSARGRPRRRFRGTS
ncbi:hypothetical protein [uncultured Cloacibacillus sp.]|uniref:hypothetical protein n=1 Tax=uncultured Cloacibacillus sp. TaxID=889794 RepID=UPI00320B784F